MGKTTVRILLLVSLLAAIPITACASQGEAYPTRPVTLTVGFAAGGSTDIQARALVEAVKPYFSQPITVVNKVGGGSSIQTSELIQAKPDGYTVGVVASTAVTGLPFLTKELPYKSPGELDYVITLGLSTTILCVKTDAPWKTFQDLISYAKANPGKIRSATTGVGTNNHITLEEIKLVTGADMTAVHFEGAAPAVTALLGGHVEAMTGNTPAFMNQVKAGTLRILVAFSPDRSPFLPDVPTLKELGYKTSSGNVLYTIAVPKGTPKNAVNALYTAFGKAIETEAYQKFVKDQAMTVPRWDGAKTSSI